MNWVTERERRKELGERERDVMNWVTERET